MAHEHHSEVGQSRGAGNGALAASGYGLGANAGFSPRELHLAIRIDNYGQAAECFGLRYADRLADAVCASLRGLGESGQIDRAVVLHAGDGWVQAVFASEGGDCLPLVHACCVVTATTPISVGRGKIVPVLSFGMPPLGAAIDGRDRDAALLRPDAVKVDAFYLKRASKTETDRRTYDHLVGLAATLAGTVIAKGVESAEDSELACDAGAYWQQGDHQGAPSLGRSWIPDRRNDQIAALEQFRDACRRGGSSGQMRGYAA